MRDSPVSPRGEHPVSAAPRTIVCWYADPCLWTIERLERGLGRRVGRDSGEIGRLEGRVDPEGRLRRRRHEGGDRRFCQRLLQILWRHHALTAGDRKSTRLN